MKKNLFLLSSVLLLGFMAIAGQMALAAQGGATSGGGNSVVCFTNLAVRENVFESLEKATAAGINAQNPFSDSAIMTQVRSVESLDFYLHKLPRGRSKEPVARGVIKTVAGETAEGIVRKVIDRLGTRTGFSYNLLAVLDQLEQLNWISADGVVRIADTGLPVMVAPECLIAQTAYRKGEYIYYDKNLFDRMDEMSKASLILHEVLYALAKKHGAKDASAVYHALSAIIVSDEEFQAAAFEKVLTPLLTLIEDPKFMTSVIYHASYRNGAPVTLVRAYSRQEGESQEFYLKNSTVLDVDGVRVELDEDYGRTTAYGDGIDNGTLEGATFYANEGRPMTPPVAGTVVVGSGNGRIRLSVLSLSGHGPEALQGEVANGGDGADQRPWGSIWDGFFSVSVPARAKVVIDKGQIAFASDIGILPILVAYHPGTSTDYKHLKLKAALFDREGKLVRGVLAENAWFGLHRVVAGTTVVFSNDGVVTGKVEIAK